MGGVWVGWDPTEAELEVEYPVAGAEDREEVEAEADFVFVTKFRKKLL